MKAVAAVKIISELPVIKREETKDGWELKNKRTLDKFKEYP